MKRTISILGIMVALNAYAADPETRVNVTSLKYVEDQLANRQDKIPAKSGDKAVTPTGTKGAIGERDIKTDLGNEATNQNDTGLTTVETVNTALNDKQASIQKLPTVNVVTYTGTNNNSNATNNYYGRGVVTSTPIYDDTTNTYGNGLVRASTLNSAVQTGVNSALTQVDETGTASNTGTLWRINDLNNVLPTTIYAQPSDTPTNYCYKRVQTDDAHLDARNSCSTTLYDDMTRGDWGVVMSKETGISYPGDTCSGNTCYKEVRGISACVSDTFTGSTYAAIAPDSLSSTLQTAYENGKSGATPSGRRCYCKATNPTIGANTAVSPWVFYITRSSTGDCALSCAYYCAYIVRLHARFRGAIFGGVSAN